MSNGSETRLRAYNVLVKNIHIGQSRMCGITLIHCEDISSIDIQALGDISHRGPDDTRMLKLERILMKFDRLSIMDLNQTGMQPFWSLDKNIVMMCNGEIFNWERLVYNYDLRLSSKVTVKSLSGFLRNFLKRKQMRLLPPEDFVMN